jgi:hypothetical protein
MYLAPPSCGQVQGVQNGIIKVEAIHGQYQGRAFLLVQTARNFLRQCRFASTGCAHNCNQHLGAIAAVGVNTVGHDVNVIGQGIQSVALFICAISSRYSALTPARNWKSRKHLHAACWCKIMWQGSNQRAVLLSYGTFVYHMTAVKGCLSIWFNLV